ncbi:hypothetical protein BVC80_901g20 [Macleaya cordata]|uniref:Uncharacterized protein n=1 Tax=Macleaya cordata TaxID=56857 RepID=A0A200QEM2_MACCD|nr:hypothetical protein BVC80_901g20 [Macleaya cordata]
MEEEIAESNERFSNEITATDHDALSRIFSQLKPYCLDLLEFLQNPKKNVSSISELSLFLSQAPPHTLQPFLDYVLFPLLLLLDAAVASRSQQNEGKLGTLNVLNMPHTHNDSVAEGVLLCLEELLKKCHLGSLNQMIVVLKKLTSGALLSPSASAEEFREGIVRCFRALLLRLHPCSVDSCMCKQIPGLPAFMGSSVLQIPVTPLKYKSEPEECLLVFLQSQDASAAVGHWLSLLLKIADTEAKRGHRGSAKLRVEAILTLRVLVAKVGTSNALAFFLPGVVSQFAKILHVSKTMISGAAGSTEAIDQTIRGLAEFLTIVLKDEANLSGLEMSCTGFDPVKDKSSQAFLEALRHLPINAQDQAKALAAHSSLQDITTVASRSEKKSSFDSSKNVQSLYVSRTKDWIEKTSMHVDQLLSATFPHLCVHPAEKVRRGLVAAIGGLLSKCSCTLKMSRLMLLECLFVLVCDDSEEVSVTAQEFLEYFLVLGEKQLIEREIAEIINRLVMIEKLPKVVLGNEETIALSHAQRLLAVMYYAGPQLLVDHLLRSPVTSARFLDVLTLCLSQNSVFAGSLDKLISAKPFSAGYLHSITELKAGSRLNRANQTVINAASSKVSYIPGFHSEDVQDPLEVASQDYEIPRMPPWFVCVGSQKLYLALAGILRLVGLSTMADSRSEVSLSNIIDIPLNYLRTLISEVRMKGYHKESWQSWYSRCGSGQVLRQASTAACILNEIMYGISDQSINVYARMFRKSKLKGEETQGYVAGCNAGHPHKIANGVSNESVWKISEGKDTKGHLIDCIGSIVHEYLSTEVWDLPIDQNVSLREPESEAEDITLHFIHDTAMLHQESTSSFTTNLFSSKQVIIDGIGIFNMCLGKDFATSGFLHSSLYLLLENLMCSSYQIRSASDAVLRIMSALSGHPTVGDLVVANADYIIDSLCRQLRHLDLNPHVPNVLAAMLSYVGVAHEILPLLEEPLRSVSLELEVIGRHQHPDLTIPFLKAVAEIAKASKHEACAMPTKSESYSMDVKVKVSNMKRARKQPRESHVSYDGDDIHGIDVCSMESGFADTNSNDVGMHLENWEEMLFKLNESKRYRRTVGSVVESCLKVATPLLASVKEATCLLALNIVEDGIATLAKVEEAYRHEKETKEAIEQAIQLCSFHDLQDNLDAADEGNDENRLLPAMNKIWPYLVVCVKNKSLVAIRRCLSVISCVVQICGGGFFSRRFLQDGPHFWKLLSTSPFHKKPSFGDSKIPLQLPYRSSSTNSEDSMAESSSLKVQAAALNMIADLSKNKRSASALEAVLKKVSGLVVGIACSGILGLRDASINALLGLSCIDPDLIWLLLADVYYSLKKKDVPSPPTVDLQEISHLLPYPLSPKEYLYAQYGGESFGFGIDFFSVEAVFQKLQL